MEAKQVHKHAIVRCQKLSQGRCKSKGWEILQKPVVCTSQAQRKTPQVVDMFSGLVVVKTFLSCHCLSCRRDGAGRTKRPENVQGTHGRYNSTRCTCVSRNKPNSAVDQR